MGKDKFIDSSLLDKAIVFATKAHKGVERNGKGFPYVVHVLEAMSIVATLTNDQELLAAAVLHDIIEDTKYTVEDLRKEFGDRVAKIVNSETDLEVKDVSKEFSWKERKEFAIKRLKYASLDSKIVAMGDKLSNMRAIYHDYKIMGNEVWNKFNVKDPILHEWHYRGLLDSLDELKDTEAYKEFESLLKYVFTRASNEEFNVVPVNNNIFVYGALDGQNTLEIEEMLKGNEEYVIDFSRVSSVNFAAIRTFVRMHNNGIKFTIRFASASIMKAFDDTGASGVVSITEAPIYLDISNYEQKGEGYTSVTYFADDQDSMAKLYNSFIDVKVIEKEKIMAKRVFSLGVATPMSGKLITSGDKKGLTFERILNKKSVSQLVAENPDKIEYYARMFGQVCKKLHTTECDTSLFPNIKDIYRRILNDVNFFNDEQKKVIGDFIESMSDVTTCIHGDLHTGNYIITDKGDGLFIDLADFAYGDPLIDIATFWTVALGTNENLAKNILHNDHETLEKFWNYFVQEYFQVKADEVESVTKSLRKYVGLRTLLYVSLGVPEDSLRDKVLEYFDFVK